MDPGVWLQGSRVPELVSDCLWTGDSSWHSWVCHLGCPKTCDGLLVGRVRAQLVLGQGLTCWWARFVWRLQVCGFVSPKIKSCWPSKPNALGAHLPGAGPLGWRAQNWAQTFPVREPLQCNYFPVCVTYPRGIGLDYFANPPLLAISLWFLMSLVIEDLCL